MNRPIVYLLSLALLLSVVLSIALLVFMDKKNFRRKELKVSVKKKFNKAEMIYDQSDHYFLFKSVAYNKIDSDLKEHIKKRLRYNLNGINFQSVINTASLIEPGGCNDLTHVKMSIQCVLLLYKYEQHDELLTSYVACMLGAMFRFGAAEVYDVKILEDVLLKQLMTSKKKSHIVSALRLSACAHYPEKSDKILYAALKYLYSDDHEIKSSALESIKAFFQLKQASMRKNKLKESYSESIEKVKSELVRCIKNNFFASEALSGLTFPLFIECMSSRDLKVIEEAVGRFDSRYEKAKAIVLMITLMEHSDKLRKSSVEATKNIYSELEAEEIFSIDRCVFLHFIENKTKTPIEDYPKIIQEIYRNSLETQKALENSDEESEPYF